MELTKTKFKQTEIGLIPTDWETCSFSDLADKNVKWSITGGPFGSNLKTSDYTSEGIQIIQLQNIGDGIFHDENQIYTSEQKANELRSCNIYPNEIILSKMGDPVARACFVPKKAKRYLMASDGIRLVIDEMQFDKYFVFSYINSKYFRNKAIEVSTGSTRQRIGLPKLKSIKLIKPTLTEQKAIATALSDVDEMIAQLEKLIEKKKAIKQGAMQQLLTPPHKGGKRLEGFSGEWTRSLVKDVIKVSRGGSPRPIQDFITTSQSGINWIKIGDTSPFSKYINSSQERIIPEGQSFSRNVFVGDFLLSNSMSFGRPYILNINGCIHDGWLVLQEYSDYFDKDFLYYTLMTTDVYRQYLSKASGSSVLNLNKELVQSVVLNRPVDLDEQRAISKILSDLDLQILEKEKTKIKLEKIKQGMMQELLTGRTRLI